MAEFIHQRSKQGAVSWLKAFETAKQRLESAADTFALSQANCDFDRQVREISFKTRKGRTYRVVFTIAGTEVLILRLRGPGQAAIDPDDLDSP